MSLIQQFFESQNSKLSFVIGICAILLGLIFLLLSMIVVSKIGRKRDERLRKRYWPYIKENLAYIAIQSVTKEGSELDYNRSFRMLAQIKRRSRKVTQWVLDEIIKQKANLSGEASKTMLKVYKDLDLKNHSLRKLKSYKWNVVAQGIHELERMGQRDTFFEFYKFLNSRSPDLRMAARLGLTTLAPNPLSFLDHLKEELSEWEQMSIYNRLRNKQKDQLPDFSKHYYHEQKSVVEFCVEMTVRFNYFELIPDLIELLKTSNRRSVVINALTELEAFQALPLVKKLILNTRNSNTIIACLRYLAHIDDERCRPIIEKFFEHESVEVRMASAAAATELGLEFEFVSAELQSMISHHQNELIS
ncbi:HEAT repeat domain-containing protein [Ekhidna sp.]|uniref:HEAT repeat domain-containing protein n=1 Tax=Ekhidna sp. TaxID=2608089 RepID=UPI0032992991